MDIRALTLAALLSTAAAFGHAQEALDGGTIEIEALANPGNLEYRTFFNLQRQLLGWFPNEPRVIDPVMLIYFTRLPEEERENYRPEGWGVRIVGDSIVRDVTVVRGGYFMLPGVPLARGENATLMFNTHTKEHTLKFNFRVRMRANTVYPYARLKQALTEFADVRRAVPWLATAFRPLRQSPPPSGVKACFADAAGAILVNDEEAGTRTPSNCIRYVYEPGKDVPGARLELRGKLEIVVLQ